MIKSFTEKLFYSIGEVSEITKVKPHVLRYWEGEFKLLNLEKNKNGERIYRKKDIDLILKIKYLLYDEGFTIAGAKKRLNREKQGGVLKDSQEIKKEYEDLLTEIRTELQKIFEKI
ncbi:MAG: MerR family transcriptional regulator [Candidatus Firestonebacteria bacterium]|nr:MerR family transcriptional regulator [Candidatus Firestonebacteria bacterium]